MCVLAGLLIGFEGRGNPSVATSLRRKLANATVRAVNLALQEGETSEEQAGNSISVMLSHVFDLLNDSERADLNANSLLPTLIHATFSSKEGLQYGYFLSRIDFDIVQRGGTKFDWSSRSPTYVQCQRMTSGPLIASLGSLSRLMAFCVENVTNAGLLSTMITDLSAFTRSLCVQWRQNKLSEIDITEESIYLSEDSLRSTIPLLWRVLKSTMFAIVIVLRSLLGRVLSDDRMAAESGQSPASMKILFTVDELQLRSWQFNPLRYYGIYTSSLRDLEQMHSRNTLSRLLLLLTCSHNFQCKPKPSFGKFGHRQQAVYHSTL